MGIPFPGGDQISFKAQIGIAACRGLAGDIACHAIDIILGTGAPKGVAIQGQIEFGQGLR